MSADIAPLRRAALRAGKALDAHVTRDDRLLASLEAAYQQDPPVLADALMDIVHASEVA